MKPAIAPSALLLLFTLFAFNGPSFSDAIDCFADPLESNCTRFTIDEAQLQADLDVICPPGATSGWPSTCTLYHECKNSTASSSSPYCNSLTLLITACNDTTSASTLCSAKYNTLCKIGSLVPQCKTAVVIPDLPTATAAHSAVFSMCSMMDMTGCDTCMPKKQPGIAQAQAIEIQCPNPLKSLGTVCMDMFMTGCEQWTSFCTSNKNEASITFPSLCGATSSPVPPSPSSASTTSGTTTPVESTITTTTTGEDSTCISNPTQASCQSFVYSDAHATDDVQALCTSMPNMVGCSLWNQCNSSSSNDNNNKKKVYCTSFSILSTICQEMGSMKGCTTYNSLCQSPKSVVKQCTDQGPLASAPTTETATTDVINMCNDHSMVGCEDCTSQAHCPHPLDTLRTICLEMPGMAKCSSFFAMCQEGGDSLKTYCDNSNSSGLPPMKMWLHAGIRDIILIKEWVPESSGAYAATCIAVIAAAVLVQALKAYRLIKEARWATERRAAAAAADPCLCGDDTTDNDSAMNTGTSSHITASTSKKQRSGSNLGFTPLKKRTMFSGILPDREQLIRNIFRAVFTGIIVFFDYMLMLIVMSFNIGIIMSAVGGFALGAFIFGHLGERFASNGVNAVSMGDAGPDPENDLEVHFVDPQTCCNSRHL